jgi:hypothetical protein
LNIEYEALPPCFVFPVDAVAQDLQEPCVFEWVGNEDNNKIWRKRPVHVIYRTKDSVVVANDGSLISGVRIASKGATLILAALEAANQKTISSNNNSNSKGIQHGDHVH